MITAFRVRNLRAIEDSGLVEIKKINVLVGKNSSGKSTILRVLPLLRQSVEQKTRGPILWYGRLVDFGSFKNAARHGDAQRGITFEFDVTLPFRRPSYLSRAQRLQESDGLLIPREGMKASVSLILGRSGQDSVGDVRSLVIRIGNDDLSVLFDSEGEVQALNVLGGAVKLPADKDWWVGDGKLLPSILLLDKEMVADDDGRTDWYWVPEAHPFKADVVQALSALAHGNTSAERLELIARQLTYGEAKQFFSHLLRIDDVPSSLKYRIEQLGESAPEIQALRRVVLLSKLSSLLEALDTELSRFSEGIRYLEPVRAIAERYYREQNLAVDDIDSRGTNTAMFLNTLSALDLESLQQWMQKSFGFMVHVEAGTGHVEIKISDQHHRQRNIADLGFGYSQVLPIILQIWRSTKQPRDAITIAIEQPELHLHPHYQAMLADVIATTTRSSYRGRLFIETHSDHFINRLGMLVALGVISPGDIQVIVVSEDEFGDSVGRSVAFKLDGTLGDNWPPGFFTPGVMS